MYRYFLYFILTTTLIFSHEFENSSNSAIPSYTKTPAPGKINLSGIYGIGSSKNSYDATGETIKIAKVKYTNRGITIDYLGEHGAGFSFTNFKTDIESEYDFDQNILGFYFLWNNIKEGIDLHDLTFKITRIKTGIYQNNLNYGEITSDAKHATFAMDFILSNKIVWTNLIQRNIKDSNNISPEFTQTRLIFDLGYNLSAAAALIRYELSESWENRLMLSAGYQFSNQQLGYLNLNFKIAPYYILSLDGKNTLETEFMGVEFHTFFN